MHFHFGAVGQVQPVDHGWCSGDEVEVELPAQSLLDDLKVQQTQEATTEAEAQRA